MRLASTGPVVRRGLKYAVVVGTVLVLINHGGAIIERELTPRHWWQMGLTMLVPFCVSVLSSVGAMLERERTDGP